MKVKDLAGNTTQWKIGGEVVIATDNRQRSGLHIRARKLLKEIFITSQIKEEVSIPVWPKRTFHLDFYIPITKIAVEVHGKQHYEFNVFFHANRMDFRMQENRDKDKIEWCSINGILLVILPYNEDSNEWRKRITNARKGQNETGNEGSG
jgi:hypothetical protein